MRERNIRLEREKSGAVGGKVGRKPDWKEKSVEQSVERRAGDPTTKEEARSVGHSYL